MYLYLLIYFVYMYGRLVHKIYLHIFNAYIIKKSIYVNFHIVIPVQWIKIKIIWSCLLVNA